MAPYWVLKSMSTTLGSPPSNGLTFAGVTPADFDELAALRIAAMRESFESVGRFDSERARERLRQSFYPEHTQVIVFGGVRVGFYTFRPVADGFQLDHLYIQPSCQSRGIGSRVIGRLLAEADARGGRSVSGHCATVRRTGSTGAVVSCRRAKKCGMFTTSADR